MEPSEASKGTPGYGTYTTHLYSIQGLAYTSISISAPYMSTKYCTSSNQRARSSEQNRNRTWNVHPIPLLARGAPCILVLPLPTPCTVFLDISRASKLNKESVSDERATVHGNGVSQPDTARAPRMFKGHQGTASYLRQRMVCAD